MNNRSSKDNAKQTTSNKQKNSNKTAQKPTPDNLFDDKYEGGPESHPGKGL